MLLLQQFRARGRGWGRGNFSGNNNSNSGGNNDFQKRSREEEWDPEYTPKSKKYYLVRTWVLSHPCAPGVSGLTLTHQVRLRVTPHGKLLARARGALVPAPCRVVPIKRIPKGGRRGAVQGGASLSHLLSLASRAARRPRGRGHGQVGEQGPRPWRLPPGKRPLHVPQVQHQPQVGS